MTLAAFVPPAGSTASPQDGVFAVMLRDGRSNPRIFAVRGRESLLGQMQQAARKKLAVSIIGKRVLLVLLLKWVSARFVCVCVGGGGASDAAGSAVRLQDGVFAVMLRDGRSNPRICAVRGRELLLGQMQQAASSKEEIGGQHHW